MMTKYSLRKHVRTAVALGAFAASPAVLAVTNWWGVGDFLDGTNAATATAKSAQGWSTTGSGGTLQSACIHDYGTNGYGIVNTLEANPCTREPGTGPHAADNKSGTDMFQLNFATAVNLQMVKIGWNGTDNSGTYDTSPSSDISILAYTGNGTPASMAGKTLSGLLSSGWQLIGQYGQVGKLANNTATITSNVSSSWWLISAYSIGFGNVPSSSGYSLTGSNDYFKLLSVAGSPASPPSSNVPEPGSWALSGIAFLALIAISRRQKRQL